jgi:hypothetical protein
LTDAQCEWLNGDEVAQAQQRFWDEAEAAKQAAK